MIPIGWMVDAVLASVAGLLFGLAFASLHRLWLDSDRTRRG